MVKLVFLLVAACIAKLDNRCETFNYQQRRPTSVNCTAINRVGLQCCSTDQTECLSLCHAFDAETYWLTYEEAKETCKTLGDSMEMELTLCGSGIIQTQCTTREAIDNKHTMCNGCGNSGCNPDHEIYVRNDEMEDLLGDDTEDKNRVFAQSPDRREAGNDEHPDRHKLGSEESPGRRNSPELSERSDASDDGTEEDLIDDGTGADPSDDEAETNPSDDETETVATDDGTGADPSNDGTGADPSDDETETAATDDGTGVDANDDGTDEDAPDDGTGANAGGDGTKADATNDTTTVTNATTIATNATLTANTTTETNATITDATLTNDTSTLTNATTIVTNATGTPKFVGFWSAMVKLRHSLSSADD